MSPKRTLTILVLAAISLVPLPSLASGLRTRPGDYEVQVLTPSAPARTFSHRGETWVLGQLGERYVIRVINHSGRRVEAVVSVDGRDVIDGRPADFLHKRGYLVPPWGRVDIEGFRLSEAEVAAFRFARVADSYAARMGDARNVGVIGVAVFPERTLPPRRSAEWPSSRAPDASPSPGAEAAPSAPSPRAEGKKSERSGLGTEFGEAVDSQVESIPFERADWARPAALLCLRYDDRQGLLAQGIDVDGTRSSDEVTLRRTASPFPESQFAAPPPGWRR